MTKRNFSKYDRLDKAWHKLYHQKFYQNASSLFQFILWRMSFEFASVYTFISNCNIFPMFIEIINGHGVVYSVWLLYYLLLFIAITCRMFLIWWKPPSRVGVHTYFVWRWKQTEPVFFFFWLNNRCRSRPACPTTGGLGFQWLIDSTHSRIVSPTYGDTVHLGLEPMAGLLLSRTSWQLYYETVPVLILYYPKRQYMLICVGLYQ